jgi:cyanophycin synthetase
MQIETSDVFSLSESEVAPQDHSAHAVNEVAPVADRAHITIRQTRVLPGPNTWSSRSVIHLEVDTGMSDNDNRQLITRLEAMLAQSGSHQADLKEIREVAALGIGEMLASLILELQIAAGDDISFSASLPACEAGVFDIACEYFDEDLAQAATALAVRLLNQQLFQTERPVDFEREFDRRMLQVVRRRSARLQVGSVVNAARRRGIPMRFADAQRTLLELGTGIHQRRFWAMSSSKTSQVGARISSSKSLTNRLLRDRGLPMPKSIVATSADEAVTAAEEIGYPVVTKPVDGKQGTGLGVDLRTPDQVRKFFAVAAGATRSGTVVVEQFIVGREHRILVINDQIAAVAERVPAHVIGDGQHTVRELIDITNADPLRGPGHQNVLTRIVIDDATADALDRQELTLDSIPEPDRHVPVKLASNMSQGGSSVDRTDEIHPENAQLARLAARALELDICGVDLITPYISQPVWTAGGAFLEVNYGPGFNLHLYPNHGLPRDVGQAVVDMLFPPGKPCQIPVVAVTGIQGVALASQLIDRILREAGHTVGVSTAEGTSIDGHWMHRPDLQGKTAPHVVLSNPYVDHAVLQVSADDTEITGLPFHACDVAVVTQSAIEVPEGRRSVETVLLDALRSDGAAILNAADARIHDLLHDSPASAILIGVDPGLPLIEKHLAAGGRTVTIVESDSGTVVSLLDGEEDTVILPVDQISVSDVTVPEGLASIMSAAAAAIALGVPVDSIRHTLRSAGT